MKHVAAIIGSFIAIAVAAASLTGCQPPPQLSLDRANLEFSATDASIPVSITSENGALDWTIESSAPWLTVSRTSGTGDAQVQISVDRSLLDPSQASTGTVRVRAGEQVLTIEVTAVSGFTPINTAYFPMAPGNSWTYSLATLNAPLDGPYLPGDINAPSLRMDVESRIDIDDYQAWQVQFSLPEFETGINFFKGATVDDLMGGVPSVDTYWVLVDGAWYVTTAREHLDLLPDTSRFAPLAALLEWPTTLAYLEASGLLEEAYIEAIGRAAIRARAIDELNARFSDYFGPVFEGDTSQLFALSGAFGATFRDYESGDPVVTASVQLLAEVSAGLEPIERFLRVSREVLVEANANTPPLLEPPLDLDYWRAWEAEFGDYVSSDEALQALVRLYSRSALEIAVIFNAAESFEQEDRAAGSEYLTELYYTISFNLGLLVVDPPAFVSTIRDFATAYPSNSEAVQSTIDGTLRILDAFEAAIPAFEDFMAFPIDTTGLSIFLDEAEAFNTAYVEANGSNATSDFAFYLLLVGLGLEPELRAVAPTLNAIVADLEAVQEAAERHLITDFEIDDVAMVMADFESFFGTYDTENDDALTAYLAIETGCAADLLDLAARIVTEAKNAPYEDVAGTLEDLLPDTPIAVAIEEFGAGIQSSDCISPRILVETEEATLHIASTIYARDIGPVLFAFLPLQYGEVNGVAVGETPAP